MSSYTDRLSHHHALPAADGAAPEAQPRPTLRERLVAACLRLRRSSIERDVHRQTMVRHREQERERTVVRHTLLG